jgi:hypothetical protein
MGRLSEPFQRGVDILVRSAEIDPNRDGQP